MAFATRTSRSVAAWRSRSRATALALSMQQSSIVSITSVWTNRRRHFRHRNPQTCPASGQFRTELPLSPTPEMSCRDKWRDPCSSFAKGVTLWTVSSIPLLGGIALPLPSATSHSKPRDYDSEKPRNQRDDSPEKSAKKQARKHRNKRRGDK